MGYELGAISLRLCITVGGLQSPPPTTVDAILMSPIAIVIRDCISQRNERFTVSSSSEPTSVIAYCLSSQQYQRVLNDAIKACFVVSVFLSKHTVLVCLVLYL